MGATSHHKGLLPTAHSGPQVVLHGTAERECKTTKLYPLLFTEAETEAQRGKGTHPRHATIQSLLHSVNDIPWHHITYLVR